MKVAILTQPLGHNYGGLLQAYALQYYLKNLGCEVETLDRRKPEDGELTLKSHVKNIIRLMTGQIKSLPTKERQSFALSKLADFRDREIIMSPRINYEHEIRDYYSSREDFDAFLVGSDQVWRPRYSPSILNYYLDFLNDINSSAKRIAYAASFGVEDWEYSVELTEKCKRLVQQFDAISVRERSAVDMCQKKYNTTCKWVVDPTLLLEVEDYEFLIQGYHENNNAKSVLSYVLDAAPEKQKIVDVVGTALGANVFSIKPEYNITQVRSKDLDLCRFPSVNRWLQAFRDASFVVTDSFHGVVFSIIFNKPFIAIGNVKRGLARFDSLLYQFGLQERLVTPNNCFSLDLIYKEVDWAAVNKLKCAISNEGKQFLKTHLLGTKRL